jgi:hypothetical protein
MLHAFTLAFLATLGYGCVYTLLGWLQPRLIHHYAQIAADPSIGGPRQTIIRCALCLALICALFTWIAAVASAAGWFTRGLHWYLALAVDCTVSLLICILVLLLVWIAFRLGAEFTLIAPEFLVAIAMIACILLFALQHLLLPGSG